MNFKSFLWPQKIYTTSSSYNKKIEVIDYLGNRFLRVNGITQSGSIVEDIYKKAIKVIKQYDVNFHKALILGFGAGTFAKLLINKYDKIKITGVEIDKEIINIAQKYFLVGNLDNINVIHSNAEKFLQQHYDTPPYHSRYELIFVDMYIGDIINKSIGDIVFLNLLKKAINNKGVIIFNRLNFGKHKNECISFHRLLTNIFTNVKDIKAYSNLLIFCQ